MKTLNIKWERLLAEGRTCPRCRSTENEIDNAFNKLEQSLNPLKIMVVLEKHEISESDFKKAPLRSNRILLNNRTIEEWIGGKTGQSPCCDVCGPSECRTINVGNKVYETITADLIIKAGLLAAAELQSVDLDHSCCETPPAKRCCPK